MPRLCTMAVNEWETMTAVYYQFSKISMHVTGQKSCGRSHLHISIFLPQQCYWLQKNHRRTLSYDWSLYTTPCLTQCNPHFSLFWGPSPTHPSHPMKSILRQNRLKKNTIWLTFWVNKIFYNHSSNFSFNYDTTPFKMFLNLRHTRSFSPK